MKDLDYIKSFSKISITSACKKLNIDRANLLNGRLKKDKVKQVREELESEVAKLYIKKESENNGK